MTKKKKDSFPYIRLNGSKRFQLKKFADSCIVEKAEKTDLGKAIIEFKFDLGNRVHTQLLQAFPQSHMEILKKYNCGIEITNIALLPIVYWNLQSTKFGHYKIPKMIVPNNYRHLSVNSYISYVTPNIRSDLKTYKNMINDMYGWMNEQQCMYHMIINKKTTLKSLVEIWPEATTFKDEWIEKRPVDSSKIYSDPQCGLFSEEEIKKRINA